MKADVGFIQRGNDMKRNARQKWTQLSEKLNDTLEIPQMAQSGAAQIELFGNREALVDGCRGVLQYEDTVVRVGTGQMIVRFTGRDLCICALQSGQLRITGTLAGIDFTA